MDCDLRNHGFVHDKYAPPAQSEGFDWRLAKVVYPIHHQGFLWSEELWNELRTGIHSLGCRRLYAGKARRRHVCQIPNICYRLLWRLSITDYCSDNHPVRQNTASQAGNRRSVSQQSPLLTMSRAWASFARAGLLSLTVTKVCGSETPLP